MFGVFDLRPVMRVEHHAEAVFSPDLLYPRKRGEQLVPLARPPGPRTLRSPPHPSSRRLRARRRRPRRRARPASLPRQAPSRAPAGDGARRARSPRPARARAPRASNHLFRLPRQEAIGSGLECRKAEAGGLIEYPLSLHLVAPSWHLANTPRDRRACHPWHHPTSDGETGRCSASERSAAIAILSASSASIAVQGFSASPLTRERKCSISAV